MGHVNMRTHGGVREQNKHKAIEQQQQQKEVAQPREHMSETVSPSTIDTRTLRANAGACQAAKVMENCVKWPAGCGKK